MRVVKAALTALLLLVCAALGYFVVGRGGNWEMLGVIGLLLFLAAALWIDYTKPTRALGLAGIVVTLGILIVAYSRLDADYPRSCSRRRLICELENLLYFAGGNAAVAALWFAVAAVVMYGSYAAFQRSRA